MNDVSTLGSDQIMEFERKRSKGGFFQLFDWNGKSRKKLFSTNSELSEESKNGRLVENLEQSLPHTTQVDEYNATSSNRGSGDFISASSTTSNEGYGSRAPGVVARLMGLESLPTHNVPEHSSPPYSGSSFLRVSHYESTPNFWNEYQDMNYTNIVDNLDRSSNPVESRFHKVHNRPIERFHTEILPPKSAKPIPITHHKLLSPIRSPGFIPTKNAAHIMEAAAKIIDSSPKTTSKGKVSSFGSSSVHLKIRDLKAKIEAAHKVSRPQTSDESNVSVVKPLKGQLKENSRKKSDHTPTYRTSRDSEKDSSNISRNKGKSIALTEQARVNVQRRGGSLSGSYVNQKERNDGKPKQFSRNHADWQRTMEKGISANRASNVLRQNNQKQNCISNRDYSTSKTSTFDQQGREARSINGNNGLSKTVNKVTVSSKPQSRKAAPAATNTVKELPISRRKNLPRKKQPLDEDLQFGKTVFDNSSINYGEKPVKCNVATDGHLNWDAEKLKTSMDVVSFTFTSPISGVAEKTRSFDSDTAGQHDLLYLKSSVFSSPGFDIIGEVLSVLLENKLHELTGKVESSNCNIITQGSPASPTSGLQNSVPSSVTVTKTPVEHHKTLQVDLDKDILYSSGDVNCSSVGNLGLDWRRKWQCLNEVEEQSACSSSIETGTELDHQHPTAVSILEPAVTSGSCSDSNNGTNGLNQFLLAQDKKGLSGTSGGECLTEYDKELSNWESSASVEEIGKKFLTRTSSWGDIKESTNWEVDYVKMVLRNSELMLIEYALGQTGNVMSLNDFNQLEHWNRTERNREDYKLEQKLLLDCMNECLELRCGQLFVGSCKGWVKWRMLIQKKGLLAEELHKQIIGWKSMGDIIVDELVDKGMSSKYGRWLDFGQEAFEEGVEMEKSILTCLVDELVSDLLL